MRDAMVAVEDRRYRSHPGVDPIGIARGIWISVTRGDNVRGVSTITQQLARNIFLTNDRSFARKVREGISGAGAGMALLQGPDPRALSQPRLFRRRRLRHRRRLAPLLRPQRHRAQRRRGGDHRRPGQGAVQLFADRRHRGRAQPRRRRPRPDGAERRDHAGRGGGGQSARRPDRPQTTASRTAPAISPTGCCPSSTC